MMKPQNVVAIAGVLVTALIAVQTATFRYVIDIEARMTRLETIIDLQGKTRMAAPATERRAGL